MFLRQDERYFWARVGKFVRVLRTYNGLQYFYCILFKLTCGANARSIIYLMNDKYILEDIHQVCEDV